MRLWTNKLGLVLAFIVSSATLKAQNTDYPDSLLVNLGDDRNMVVAFQEIRLVTADLDDQLWKSILNSMETAVLNAEESEGIRVTYQTTTILGEEQAQIRVSPLDGSDIFRISDKGLTHLEADRIEFQIIKDKVSLFFYLDQLQELEAIKALNVDQFWEELSLKKDEMKTKHVLYQAKGEVRNGLLNVTELKNTNKTDRIELGVGIGIGFYRERFVPDITVDAAFLLDDRFGNPLIKAGLQMQQQHFFSENEDGSFRLDENVFLSGFFSKELLGVHEIGFGIGFLVGREGNFYQGTTMKFTLTNKSKSGARFTPELIITDDFRQAIPAISLGFAF
jgi:hypothetical protein